MIWFHRAPNFWIPELCVVHCFCSGLVCNWNFENSILLWLRCNVDEKVCQLVAFRVQKLMKRTHTHEFRFIRTFRKQCERQINILIVFLLLLSHFRFSSIVWLVMNWNCGLVFDFHKTIHSFLSFLLHVIEIK